jgi:molybdopterin synthase sulfur carrier subunit
MEVQVRYFASLTDKTGIGSEAVAIDESASVADLWVELVRRHPGLSETGFKPMVACDMEYADWNDALKGVREVAFLPPVSGG